MNTLDPSGSLFMPYTPLSSQVLLFLQEEKEEIAAETQVTLAGALCASRCSPWGSWCASGPRARLRPGLRAAGPPAPAWVTPFT